MELPLAQVRSRRFAARLSALRGAMSRWWAVRAAWLLPRAAPLAMTFVGTAVLLTCTWALARSAMGPCAHPPARATVIYLVKIAPASAHAMPVPALIELGEEPREWTPSVEPEIDNVEPEIDHAGAFEPDLDSAIMIAADDVGAAQ